MPSQLVNFTCTPETLKLLEKLKKDTGQKSRSAVINLAIAELAKMRGLK